MYGSLPLSSAFVSWFFPVLMADSTFQLVCLRYVWGQMYWQTCRKSYSQMKRGQLHSFPMVWLVSIVVKCFIWLGLVGQIRLPYRTNGSSASYLHMGISEWQLPHLWIWVCLALWADLKYLSGVTCASASCQSDGQNCRIMNFMICSISPISASFKRPLIKPGTSRNMDKDKKILKKYRNNMKTN